MSEHPKLGMYYETGRKKLKGVLGKDPQIRGSILNQVRLHEGETATSEIQRELSLIEKRSSAFSGAGPIQTGIGDGEKFESGKYTYEHGAWVKL